MLFVLSSIFAADTFCGLFRSSFRSSQANGILFSTRMVFDNSSLLFLITLSIIRTFNEETTINLKTIFWLPQTEIQIKPKKLIFTHLAIFNDSFLTKFLMTSLGLLKRVAFFQKICTTTKKAGYFNSIASRKNETIVPTETYSKTCEASKIQLFPSLKFDRALSTSLKRILEFMIELAT